MGKAKGDWYGRSPGVPTPARRERPLGNLGRRTSDSFSYLAELCRRHRPLWLRQNQEVLSTCSTVWSGHTVVSGKFRAGASRKALFY